MLFGENMLRYTIASCCLGLLACSQPATPPPAEPQQCPSLLPTGSGEGSAIVSIGKHSISVADVERRINDQPPFVRQRYETRERLEQYVDRMIERQLFAMEAIERGVLDKPRVLDTVLSTLAQELSREVMTERVNVAEVTDEEAKTYYDEHQSYYNKDEAVRVSHIYFQANNDKAAAKAEAEKAHEELAAAAKRKERGAFRDAAQKYSDDEATKSRGGDLMYLTETRLRERYGDGIAKSIWNLPKLKAMTPVVEGRDGFHIFRLTGRRQALHQSFDTVKERIRHRIFRDRRRKARESYFEELKTKYAVSVNKEAFAEVKVAKPAPKKAVKAPAGAPNSQVPQGLKAMPVPKPAGKSSTQNHHDH
tara:strand:+ start:715 stop:1806 length:1092 start_codon:yes stop_codon:yes gene_type:complete